MAEELRRITSLRNMSLLRGCKIPDRNMMRDCVCHRATLAQRYYLFEDLEVLFQLEKERKEGKINRKQAIKLFQSMKKQVKGDYAEEFLFLDSDGEFKPGVSYKKAHESSERYVRYDFGIYIRKDLECNKETLEERVKKTVFFGTHSTTLSELTEEKLPEIQIDGLTTVKWKEKIAYFKGGSQKYLTLSQARRLFKNVEFETVQVEGVVEGFPVKMVLVSFEDIVERVKNKRLRTAVRLKFFQKEVLTK